MEITQQGRNQVASLEFAERVRDLVYASRRIGKCEEEWQQMLVLVTAFTLADKAADEVQMVELECFISTHADEIEQAVSRALEKLMCLDTTKGFVH